MVDLVDSSPIDWYDDKDDGCYDMDLEEELYNTYLENLDLTEAGECEIFFTDCNKRKLKLPLSD